MSSTKNKLSEIKSGAISRGLALAKMSISAGAKAATHTLDTIFASENERTEKLKKLILSQAKVLTKELGELKGSLMKVGQMLSMFGEHFLPPEANAVLKSLQNQSPPLEWAAIERVLIKQLGKEKLAELEVEKEPWASASLGQVHRAKTRDGKQIALKIQYPGVDRAIDSDLKTLKSIFNVIKLIPKGAQFDNLFEEVRQMLHQEVDYEREKKYTIEMKRLVSESSLAGRCIVPDIFERYCTSRVIATSFEEGVPVDSPDVLNLSDERRNSLGLLAMEVYFHELFKWGKVQTDPHFGNYKIRVGHSGVEDKIILLDFGAVRELSTEFLDPYYLLVKGAVLPDRALTEKASFDLGFFEEGDSQELRTVFCELCELITEPYKPGVYDWGKSDLPKRVAKKGAQLAVTSKLRSPPQEVVFLDRKMGGMFILMSVLRVNVDARQLLLSYLPK
ncbi:MAG: ABC1 kinase family protein [Bacteriovoracia bacterium]